MPEQKEKDWVTPLAIFGGGAALVGGAYLLFKKKGVAPGAKMVATFKYRHVGDSGSYYFQVALGHIRLVYFDEVEGLKWREQVDVDYHGEWTDCITKIGFQLPEMMDAGEYDAEGSIRDISDKLIIRYPTKSAVVVPK